MHSNIDRALDFILEDEGGYAVRATEPGGAVNMGVSMAAFQAWRHAQHKHLPTLAELESLRGWEARLIYIKDYAAPIGFDDLPAALDYCMLDAAVNEGIGGAKALLQHTASIADVAERIKAVCELRLAAKRQRKEWAKFGAGWSARIGVRVPDRALAMLAAAKA